MAMFGNLEVLKKQITDDKLKIAFEYLTRVLNEKSEENKRLNSYDLDVFEKIDLDVNNFALEQTYLSKDREQCFFESHRKYIDVQFILEGEEIIEVDNINNLNINFEYDKNMDLIKYDDSSFASAIKLKKGDVAIFLPDDAHLPCIKVDAYTKVIKTVVKVAV